VIPPKKKKKTTTGGFSSGIFGFVIGPIIFVMSFVGTWFNEKRAAVNYKRLKLVGSLLKN
jgi:hypothetical protein